MPLTDDDILTWHGRLELARRYRKEFGNTDGRWDKNVQAMAGDFGSRETLGPEAIDVNITHSTLETLLTPLSTIEPFITFRPTRPRVRIGGKDVDNIQRAEFAEAEINYWMRELEVSDTAEAVVNDAEATNHGYALVWISKKGDLTNKDGEKTEPDPTIQEGRPLVKRLSPKQVLIPPGPFTTRPEEAPWLAIEWLRPIQDVVDKYGVDKEDLPVTHSQLDDDRIGKTSSDFNSYLTSDDNKLVKVIQVFAKRTKQVLTFAEGHDGVLDEEKWDLETEGFPIAHMAGGLIPDEYFGTPPMQYSMPQQIEMNASRTSLRKNFNRTKQVILTTPNIADEANEKYAQAEDGTMIGIDFGDDDIRKKIIVFGGIAPDTGSILYNREISGDYFTISGLSNEQRGGGDPNIETATQSSIVDKWAQVRASKRAGRMRDFYFQVATKLWMILQQNTNVKRDRLVAGPLATQFKTLSYTLGEIRGEFALEIDVSSFLSQDPQTRIRQSLGNYNLLRGDPLVNPQRLVLDVLKAQNIANPVEYLLQLRTPQEELQMVMQGLPVEAHERDDHEFHTSTHAQQIEQLSQALNEVRQKGDANLEQVVSLGMSLLLAHQNDHARKIQQIVGPSNGRPAGQPVQENSFRNQLKVQRGGETPAEIAGGPVGEA